MIFQPSRRQALKGLINSSLLAFSCMLPLPSSLWAQGTGGVPQGMQKVRGEVFINDAPAQVGDIVRPGDVVATGPGSLAVFSCGESVFMMKENGRLVVDIDAKTAASQTGKETTPHMANKLKLLKGKLLSVFAKRNVTLETPDAYVGIQGTGLYCEIEHGRTYVCTCYGTVLIRSNSDPKQKRSVSAVHHEMPLYIYSSQRGGANGNSLIENAPMKNHSDADLIQLEAVARRSPPFVEDNGGASGGTSY